MVIIFINCSKLLPSKSLCMLYQEICWNLCAIEFLVCFFFFFFFYCFYGFYGMLKITNGGYKVRELTKCHWIFSYWSLIPNKLKQKQKQHSVVLHIVIPAFIVAGSNKPHDLGLMKNDAHAFHFVHIWPSPIYLNFCAFSIKWNF